MRKVVDFDRTDRGRMTDRNRELAPGSWSLVRERVLTSGLYSEGWYSEHSHVCRREDCREFECKGEEGLKGGDNLKGNQRRFVLDLLLSR